jgi:hypothetical protein
MHLCGELSEFMDSSSAAAHASQFGFRSWSGLFEFEQLASGTVSCRLQSRRMVAPSRMFSVSTHDFDLAICLLSL